MRLSIDPSDRAYGDPRALKATILFNGEPHKDVLTADEEVDMIVYYVRDDAGQLVIDLATGELQTATSFGKVTIVFIS
jgi:hypothetical protein